MIPSAAARTDATDASPVARLEKFRLFEGLRAEDRARIASLCARLEVEEGEAIVEQDTTGEELYLVDEGELAVVREEGGLELVVNHIREGQDVGIMAMFDGGVRTATLRATRRTVVHRLRFSDFHSAFGDLADSPLALMFRNELRMYTEFLKEGNTRATASLRRELDESRRRLRFGSFVAVLIGSVTLYAFLLRLFLGFFAGKIESTYVTVGILIACVAIYVPMMKRSGFPLATYGLSLREWRSSLRESLVWTSAFLVGVTLLKWLALRAVPAWHGQPLFSFYGFTRYDSVGKALALMGVYALFAPIQELVARGAMQSSLHEFLTGRRADAWAILLSTLMFAQIHLHLTPAYAFAVFFPSLFWGAMYARQRTLLGVSVSHVLIGVYVAFFLGLPLMVH